MDRPTIEALGLPEGATPFPWQERLLDLLRQGRVPDALDLPTGLGKTKVIALWLLALLEGAAVPRRLVYVVDRRAIVDQATAEAERLRSWLESRPGLRSRLGLERSLPISTLRGEHVDNRAWMEDPTAPAIIVGTVDMVGSRLLFQGYGVSRNMRSMHAGLLATDTLFVLDESHLVPPFQGLVRDVVTARSAEITRGTLALSAPRVLALSATGQHSGEVFGLDSADLEHPVVAQRLAGSKRLHLHPEVDAKALPAALADGAWDMATRLGAGSVPRVIVFCTSRDTAQKTKALLDKRSLSEGALETELFVGARRGLERERQAKRLVELGFVAGAQRAPTTPAVLVATSAGEVGVDLDAHHAVCDVVAWERMVQRLGRVNRRGARAAVIHVIPGPLRKGHWTSLDTLLAPIRALPMGDDGGRDVSISGLLDHPAPDLALAATTLAPLRPPLRAAQVWDWSMTGLPDHPGRPEPGPWLRGWLPEDPPQTRVCWRHFVPDTAGSAGDVQAFFQAAWPHPWERLETETYRVAEWLIGRAKRCSELSSVLCFGTDRTLERVLTHSELLTLHKARVGRLIAGRTLVVDRRFGGLESGLLNGKFAALPSTLDAPTDQDPDPTARALWSKSGARITHVPADREHSPPPGFHTRAVLVLESDAEGKPLQLLVLDAPDAGEAEDARSAGRAQKLDAHQECTREQATHLATALGLPQRWRVVLERAARWHDQGKAAARWQEAFRAPIDGVYAKTRGPINQARLGGYRHELGSVLALERDSLLDDLDADQRALVLHIVLAHHGRARPTIPVRGCDGANPSRLEGVQREAADRFLKLQERWGPWGLAYWEALLRCADFRASALNDARREA